MLLLGTTGIFTKIITKNLCFLGHPSVVITLGPLMVPGYLALTIVKESAIFHLQNCLSKAALMAFKSSFLHLAKRKQAWNSSKVSLHLVHRPQAISYCTHKRFHKRADISGRGDQRGAPKFRTFLVSLSYKVFGAIFSALALLLTVHEFRTIMSKHFAKSDYFSTNRGLHQIIK